MKKFLALILMFFLFGTVNAAILINTDYPYFPEVTSVQLRSYYDSTWGNSITAEDKDVIDVRAEIFLDYDNYYADHYYNYSEVQANAEIYGWDDGWEYIKTTDTRHFSLYYLNYQTVYWYDAFFVDDSYSQYRVIVKAWTPNYYNESSNTAYVDVVNEGFDSYCSDIEILSNSVAMNENETEYITFNVKNNSNERFYIKGVSPTENESFFGVFSQSYDSSIASGDTSQIKLRVTSNTVNEDRTGTATVRITGEFAHGENCGYSDIEKDFTVKVSNSAEYESCSDISIIALDERMQENNTETFAFNVKNYSDNGFYVDEFDVSDNSSYFNATEDYKPSFIPANSEREFTYKVNSSSVSGDKTEKITLRVSGNYSNGRTCSYSQVGEETIDLTIEDNFDSEQGYCSDLSLNTKDLSLNENDVYSTSFSVKNNSDTRFNITGISFNESNTSVDFLNVDFPSYISADSTTNVSFRVETESVSSTKNIPVYFEVKGRFENGRTCSFSDARERFDVEIRNSGSGSSGSCSGIDVLTQTVEVEKGETKTVEFSVENNENRKFYIDYVNVYDNDSKITSAETFYSSIIPVNSQGTIKIRVKGLNTGTATAYIEVRGHFENSTACSVNDIEKESFTVRIGETSSGTEDSCADFILDVPSSKSVLGKEKIVLRIDNPLSKTGEIRISGTNLSVSPHTISIPKNSSFTETIEVELLEGKESYLVYNISLEGCTVRSKTTKVFSGQESFEVIEYPSEKTIALNDSISFILRNNTASSKEFNIFFEGLPSNWNINEKSVVIPANSDRTISIELEAENSGAYNAILAIESDGRKIEKEIQLTVQEKEIKVTAETTEGILNEKELKITIENQTEKEIKGNAVIELPENWTMEGNTAIEVNAEETKIISFKLKTDGKNLEKEIPVRVELDNGKNFVTEAKPKTTGTTTALISLGQNLGTVIGLLAIVIIIVILLARR
jgi:hypothetical protein